MGFLYLFLVGLVVAGLELLLLLAFGLFGERCFGLRKFFEGVIFDKDWGDFACAFGFIERLVVSYNFLRNYFLGRRP